MANNAEMFEQGADWCVCVSVPVSVCMHQQGLQYHVFMLLNNNFQSFKQKFSMGSEGLGRIHGENPLYVCQEKNETALYHEVFVWNDDRSMAG